MSVVTALPVPGVTAVELYRDYYYVILRVDLIDLRLCGWREAWPREERCAVLLCCGVESFERANLSEFCGASDAHLITIKAHDT